MALGGVAADDHVPSGTGTPAARKTNFAMSFCMASAEASTPEWRVGNAERSPAGLAACRPRPAGRAAR